MVDDSNNIKVSVRVRPLLPREKEKTSESKCLVSMPTPQKTILEIPKPLGVDTGRNNSLEEKTKTYLFDECIWSYDVDSTNYTNNKKYYNQTGPELLSHLFQGYNVCLLAYGQTSSGKTYTMMGNRKEPGIIPLLIRDILKQMEVCVNEKINCELKFSYMEIYNEQVRDLLGNNDSLKCKVREHPQTGPYVENVQEYIVRDYSHFLTLLNQGNHSRSTAQTSMNDKSSRSHAIITLTLKQTRFESENQDDLGDAAEEMISNIKLVDLAGSERLGKTKLYGQQERIKEGTLINKSLTVLGRCIGLLAGKDSNTSSSTIVVPYRESILTYILRENLSGNSKTCMIFCISPVDFEETHQTLNYANEVKKIKTAARANKTKLSKVAVNWEQLQQEQTVINSLKKEIEVLTEKLSHLEKSTPSENSKFDKIIEFLDRESIRVKFENKYLKQVIKEKNNHIEQLNNHIDYIENEYETLFIENKLSKQQQLVQTKQDLLTNVYGQIEKIDLELKEFNPDVIF
ncbi:Kinesin-related protein 1 [Spathaspora sp. JA1]|nr:Kinesin-related protein 1 [Spathaspora sp. JA1]